MPTSAPRPCAHAGCPALVTGRSRCDAHQRARDAQDRDRRGSAHQRGYGAKWQAYRRRFLQQHPLCLLCGGEGRIEPATVVDHVVPHKGDQRLFWDASNHRPLCKPHHDRIVDQGDFGRAVPQGEGRGESLHAAGRRPPPHLITREGKSQKNPGVA